MPTPKKAAAPKNALSKPVQPDAALAAVVGKDPLPPLSTLSNTLPGVRRSWPRTEDVVQEVVNARIWDGVHYRNSGEVGVHMGEQVGAVVAKAYGMN